MTVVYEHPNSRREVLTASGEIMSRDDAKCLGYDIAAYTELVAPSSRIATTHPEHFDIVNLPPFGLTTTVETAKAMGFTVSGSSTAPRVSPRVDPTPSRRSAIMQSPEAKSRPSATAELLTSHPDMSVESARAFLRGLPTEQAETKEAPMTNTTDPKAARLAEIQGSMAAFNVSAGYATRAKRPAVAPSLNDIDPARLRRMCEIKLNALNMNGKSMSQEAKTLKLALDTNATVGTPLDRAFAQLGADMSKIISA